MITLAAWKMAPIGLNLSAGGKVLTLCGFSEKKMDGVTNWRFNR